MEKGIISCGAEDGFILPSPPSVVVAAAITGDRSSRHVIKWMLDNFSSEDNVIFKLLHVRRRISSVPTPMGNLIPISQVREDVAAAYRKEMEWRANEKISPYKKMLTQKKVPVEVILIESDDVPNAIAEEVSKGSISKLVIGGASSSGIFSRKLMGRSMSPRISKCVPSICTVYATSKGKLRSVRPSDFNKNASTSDARSDRSFSTSNSSSVNFTLQTGSGGSSYHLRSNLPMQSFQTSASVDENLFLQRATSNATCHTRDQSLDVRKIENAGTSCPVNSEIESIVSRNSTSYDSFPTDSCSRSRISDHGLDAYVAPSQHQEDYNLELEKLRIELRHVRGMYAIAQSETVDASRQIDGLNKRRIEEAVKLKEIEEREERAIAIAREESDKYKAAKREAEAAVELAQQETAQRVNAENRALYETKMKEKLQTALTGPVQNYQIFSWEELVAATTSFSQNFEIGRGAYGIVYKCTLHHTAAAVKILHSNEARRTNQFQKELEILSKIRHPHLLTLLGACPDHGCIVYEYMKNGNLEERLQCKNNTAPIPWVERFRIAWEVASALVFLHSTKPKPIIHRDLKPANILLDQNFVSKIGDVGLSTNLHLDPSSAPTMQDETGLVGTMCYIDPEYQRSGIVSPMSDVYSFGMVVLQLLTGKQAMGLAHVVEMAVMGDYVTEVLDSKAGNWPIEQAKELAKLGLSCVEIRRKDRPDLLDEVLPKLEKLKLAAADQAGQADRTLQLAPPSPFICPIRKEVMEDPHVAADGYSYDLKAITQWLEETDQSPTTGLRLPHKYLIPNYTLLSAIMEWKLKTK